MIKTWAIGNGLTDEEEDARNKALAVFETLEEDIKKAQKMQNAAAACVSTPEICLVMNARGGNTREDFLRWERSAKRAIEKYKEATQ